jgi:hypothetical protein
MGRIVFSSRGAGLVFVVLACLFPASAGAVQQPLPASNYSTEGICGPPLPGRVSCFAERLVPETKAARSRSHPIGMVLAQVPTAGQAADGTSGLRPEDLHNVYELPTDAPGTQTIGIVDAFDDPTIEADLQVYDEEFDLPECTHASGCFTKLNQAGAASPLPATSAEWAVEITLDVESAHAVCQNCKIVLVEAESNSDFDLEIAEEAAVAAGADEVSNSYGAVSGFATSAYDHPGVVITASTGDWGYDNWEETGLGIGANYPASSPDVVAVGGTELSPFTTAWIGETAWSDAGSGCGTAGAAPVWQTSLPNWTAAGCGGERAVADISADADPFSGIAIYDSTPYSTYFPGWQTFGGTSLSSPIVAAEFALAGGSHGVAYPAQTIYANRGSSGLHDIVSGSNLPTCGGSPICVAGSGWDGPTGVGSPTGLTALQPGPQPAVTGVSPASGPSRGGQTVTISGTELANAAAVEFGETEASIISDTAGSITVEAPSHRGEVVDVTVTGPTGNLSATSPADQYEYIELTPHVTAIFPAEGTTAGGTTVTLEGTGLGEISMVEFGAGYFTTPILVEEDRVTTISLAHPAMPVQVFARGQFKDANPTQYQFVTPRPTDTLTVHLAGSGSGTVTMSPGGIDCSATCSHGFEEGTAITLSGLPDSGSSFAGWSGGGCTGTNSCHLTLGGDTEVTATFEVPVSIGNPPSGNPPVTVTKPPAVISNPQQETGGGNAGALAACLGAAQKAYRHAVRAAHSKRSGSAAALRKAKRMDAKQAAACHKRL